jgi:signal transduction histidine kinase/ActR/RegA family two-component response regulator
MSFFTKTSSGKDTWLEIFLMPFTVEKQTHLLVMGMDITQRIQAEKAKEEMEDQLRQAHKMEAIGTLAGGIAHDFNNILSAILGYSEMARKEMEPESPTRSKIDKVIKSGNRARELIMQILSFSRKSDQEEKIPIQVHIIVEEVFKLLRATIPATIDIRLKIDPGCGYIRGNSIQIHQVMINLCGNAAQAMEEKGGLMTVSLSPVVLDKEDLLKMPDLCPGAYIRLSVQDTGIGIPKDIIDRVFDPYFTTKDVGKGSGMGLAVVHGIVKAHEGALTVASTPGAGTTFDVYFPQIQTQTRQIPPEKEISSPAAGTEHILVVDDEESLVEISILRLESLGYQVTGSTSSGHALKVFMSDPKAFDLVVTDHTMPGMTGKQLAEEMLAVRPDLPIILCSGYAHHIDDPERDITGIKAFALKPIDVDELTRLIRRVLDGEPVSH